MLSLNVRIRSLTTCFVTIKILFKILYGKETSPTPRAIIIITTYDLIIIMTIQVTSSKTDKERSVYFVIFLKLERDWQSTQ